ncbi:pyridoxal phosphate-dependent aminotransferase [Vallitalea sp.]|jgi:threonine-phosphate decarboxylase|uniref:pyridoxal phosphate-dependent aminotransferase n=1 Tax=Vallitalea sp. TaxID=1882829 RepID=UPI0025EC6533|nr:histidinol-phosphate transaminase [Vallitalea sp.]MCT4688885.1 aminotransferase class I/II-fold pyridoxal phosphate-dependent enzyme [Vallitalea sp.]
MNKHGGYYGNSDIIDYSVNINPLGLTDNIRETIISSIDNICKYPDIGGTSAKEAVAKHINVGSNKIIMGNGASELIYLFARALKPKKVLIIEPTFNEYRRAFLLAGSEIDDYVLDSDDDFRFNEDMFSRKMEAFQPDVVILCNPNNPTGKYLGLEMMSEIVDIVKRENSFLFIDESFVEFTGYEPIGNSIDYEHIFSLRSMTKYYAVPGLRIGYGVTNDKIIEKMEEYKEPWTMNTFALDIVPKVIGDKSFCVKVNRWVKIEREYMYEGLSNVRNLKVYKSYSNFFLCKLNYLSGNMLNLELLKDNMYVRVCDDFKSLDEGFVRIGIKRHVDNEKMVSILNKIL